MSQNLVQLRRRKGSKEPHASPLTKLAHVMEEQRVITPADIARIAKETRQPEAAVYGVATFYGDLGLAQRGRTRIQVCKGDACHAAALDAQVGWVERGAGVRAGEVSADGAISVEGVYCVGACHAAPAAVVEGKVIAGLTEESARLLGNEHGSMPDVHEAFPVRCEAHDGPAIVLERLARPIDATKLEAARAAGVFEGLKKALTITPDAILAEVEASGLRGRGGAGFPTAQKWRLTRPHALAAGEAYVVCNGDEGDPGSYIDGALMERDPFAVLEGIAIAGRAIGASRGYLYVRSEYPRSAPTLRRAIEDARAAGVLGSDVLGSGWAFDVEVVGGAGSYVCGEETALLRSIEGLRGMVTARPPYPAEKGLFGKPTIVNNVETLANVGWILRHGGAAYAQHGIGKSRGTKTFSLNERFARPGIYEVPLGTSLRRVLVELGGGPRPGHTLKAIQIGGPLGGILLGDALDVPVGFEELAQVGALLGHGGVVAWDERANARDIARHLLEFCDAESCGKCFPCRIGGKRGLELVERLPQRSAAEIEADLVLLDELMETMKLASLCAHGGAIPDPIRSLMKHFPAEMRGGKGAS